MGGYTKGRPPQPLLIRITHWLNVPAIVVMAMSGLQILRAYPFFGPQGARYDWVPLQGWESPDWVRAGGWLGAARHLHFAFAWLLVLNALVYIGYLIYSREWKRRFFWPPRDTKPAIHQALYYIRVRKDAPKVDLYNGLQRMAYTTALVLATLEILSGFAIWKPVQLSWLAALFGGYDGARVVHFLALLALTGFVITHLIMVIVHWRQFPEMVTGGEIPLAAEALPAAIAAPVADKPALTPSTVAPTEPSIQALASDAIATKEETP
ncbi:MAG TPA: cytochrome b/b6 domain-containing protein [Kofleriaceae bacterium]|nr:cytochrome b/b6 domain-containing protein [Kofleriaceae bacterium]